uniref:Kinesin-like protein KIF28P isoform X1 n=1 Tax=Crassostrea virginica TaxID=6565 RepID=A0A8B8D5V6_CRAVI|nr:kinesin-like protein KIF28P isoform X1 [Crassostrea virginica]
MPEENVRVAVRVRPFNRRERERNATLIIDMNGATTQITDPAGADEPRKFTFDYSFWSHDGSKEDANGYYGPDTSHPNGKKFADQKKVYDALGVAVLKNAWEGYNSTLFAYGQTGSGKSWSVVGYGINKGIVPMFCDDVFKQIEAKKAEGDKTEFEITFSMLEIYNEQVRDLLDSSRQKGGLRVRQHPKLGFYADGLKIVPVSDYADIEKRMEEGTQNRTVASTNMNATSSRAHTIVGITFVQKFQNAAGEETTKTAVTNLVDLAGSERADSTGATGDRLKEGAAINQSLSCLGNVIAALADRSSGKNTRVPYRDSVLTKLLKNALGGNSKTIMIAALSPADINFDETLSTLRYADRAKQIKNSASVNEDPTEKLIRELQEENEKLKAALASGNLTMVAGEEDDDLTDEERAQIKSELEDQYKSILDKNAQEMEDMKKTFEERLKEAEQKGGGSGTDFAAINEKKKTVAHLSNLNLDPQLSGHITHFVEAPEVCIGAEGDIAFKGPSVVAKHAIIRDDGGKFTIEACDVTNRLLQNGKAVVSKQPLKHNDRLIFGTTQYFVFVNPKERDASKEKFPEVTFEMAQEEVAKKSGFDMSGENKSREDALLQEDMLEIMPAVEEANAISQELDKKMKFESMVVSPEARGELSGRTEVMIKATNIETKHEWIWPKVKFMNRKYVMQEMYNDFLDGDDPWELPPEKDPFLDDINAEFHIGSVKIWLQSTSYMIAMKEQLDIIDYRGYEVGKINIELVPCNKSGKEFAEDEVFVEDPSELVGKEIFFKLKLENGMGLPTRFTDLYAKYIFNHEPKPFETKKLGNTINPQWAFSQVHGYAKATEKDIDFLKDGAIMLQVWGKQKLPKEKKTVNTKDAMIKGNLTKGQTHNVNTNNKKVDPEKVKYMMKCAMLEKKTQHLEQKLAAMKKMLEEAEKHKKKKLTVDLIQKIYHAPSNDAADKCIALIPQEKDDTSSESSKSSSSSSSSSDDEKKEKKKHKRSLSARERKKEKNKDQEPKRPMSVTSIRSDKAVLKPQKRKESPKAKKQTSDAIKSQNKSSSCVLL